MEVYFHFLNDWILLDEREDSINGDSPSHFVEFIDKYDRMNGFVKILHNDEEYYLHMTNIQWRY